MDIEPKGPPVAHSISEYVRNKENSYHGYWNPKHDNQYPCKFTPEMKDYEQNSSSNHYKQRVICVSHNIDSFQNKTQAFITISF